MFKAKVVALYILLTVLTVLTSLNLLGNDEEGVRRSNARARAQNAIVAFKAVQERDEQRRADLGEWLAEGPLAGYLATLRKFRVELVALEEDVYDAYPTSDSPQEEVQRGALRRKYIRDTHGKLLKNFSESVARSVFPRLPVQGEGLTEAKFALEVAIQLEEWGAVGRNLCLHRFTYLPLMEALEGWKGTVDAKDALVVVVDDRGTGWANNQNAKWSEKVAFAEEQPLVREARKGTIHGIVRLGDVYYFATAVPIEGRNGRRNGTILVGQEVDMVNYAAPLAKALGVDFALMRSEQLLIANRDDSNFLDYVSALVDEVPQGPRHQGVSRGVEDSDFEGVIFYLMDHVPASLGAEMGIVGSSLGKDLRVVLGIDVSQELDDLGKVTTVMPLIGMFVCLLGCVFLIFAVWYYRRPFERIDQGIHEIIGGNQSYEFEFDFNEELPDSIAQNLNMMVAILTGRPLPDDIADARSQNWVESMLIGSAFNEEGVEASGTPGIDATAEVGPQAAVSVRSRNADELKKEPAEKYYRRIFNEYIAMRERLGMNNEGVTYVRFVDKVVKSERSIKEDVGARAVRFNIEEKGGNAVLTPVLLS